MRKAIKRVLEVLLVFMMMFLLTPAIGGMNAFAGGDVDLDGLLKGGDSSGKVEAGTTVYVLSSALNEKYGGESIYTKWKNKEVSLTFRLEKGTTATDVVAKYKDGKFYYVTKRADDGKKITFFTGSKSNSHYNNNTNSLTVYQKYLYRDSVPASNGSFTLTGYSSGAAFDRLNIYDADGKFQKAITSIGGSKSFSFKFKVADYKPGYYNMVGVLKDGSKVDLSIKASDGEYYKTYFQSPITKKPKIKYNKNYFSTGYNYICFRPYFSVDPDYDGIYLQLYDTKTKKWGDIYGPFGSYEILRTDYFTGNKGNGTKIKANRKYKARVMYGKNATYNGYTMLMTGPYSNTVTVRTGKSTKPAVKSISIKVVSTKKIKLITHAHWDVYGKWVPYSEDYTWTTKYKVTVKLKKKPGTTGIMIGDKKIKGNKKTYSATFEDSGKLKGKKITIGVCTYNDAKVGGYGKVYKKKVKVR